MLFETLKTLCDMDGMPGREHTIAEYIQEQIKNFVDDVIIDNLGNVIAYKKGKNTAKNKIMLSAHMDEVGLMATGVTDSGYIRFEKIGTLDVKNFLGRAVKANGKIGVIGTKPIHCQNQKERESIPKLDDLHVDIGANNKEDAEKYVSMGDCIYLVSEYKEFGDGFIKAKALDDRAGCAILMEIIKSDIDYDAYFAFTVQGELSNKGATVAANRINPDIAIIIENTASGDVAEVKGFDKIVSLGDGAAISYMDMGTIYDKQLYDLTLKTAKEKNIKCQVKTKITDRNDANVIHKAGNGAKAIAISVPNRYIHSPASVVKKSDVQACLDLALSLLNSVGEL